jgi:hypothetical protein
VYSELEEKGAARQVALLAEARVVVKEVAAMEEAKVAEETVLQ